MKFFSAALVQLANFGASISTVQARITEGERELNEFGGAGSMPVPSPSEMVQLSSLGGINAAIALSLKAAKLAADTMSTTGGKLPVNGKSGKGIQISPNFPCSASSEGLPTKLLGPNHVVPLLLECFETVGYRCSMFQTVVVVWRDKQCLKNANAAGGVLGGSDTWDFLNNQSAEGDDISSVTINVTTGHAQSFTKEYIPFSYSPDFGNYLGDQFLMYCCHGTQFQKGGEGDSRCRN